MRAVDHDDNVHGGGDGDQKCSLSRTYTTPTRHRNKTTIGICIVNSAFEEWLVPRLPYAERTEIYEELLRCWRGLCVTEVGVLYAYFGSRIREIYGGQGAETLIKKIVSIVQCY